MKRFRIQFMDGTFAFVNAEGYLLDNEQYVFDKPGDNDLTWFKRHPLR